MKTWHVPCNSLAGAHQFLILVCTYKAPCRALALKVCAHRRGDSSCIASIISRALRLFSPRDGWAKPFHLTTYALQSPLAGY